MNESITEILDVLAWIIGGLFVGLVILGSYNFYQEYQESSVPSRSLTPLEEDKIQPKRQEKNFQKIDEFHLVQKHSPRESSNNEETDTISQSEEGESQNNSDTDTELPITELPYQLTGTTTGAIGFSAATVRKQNGKESRMLTSGKTWNEFKVLSITEKYIVIRNNETDSRERMPLNEEAEE